MQDHAADADAGLLEDLAPDRLLDGLARLEEAGQDRVEARGPAALAAQEEAAAVVGEDGGDHGGVGAGEGDVGDGGAGGAGAAGSWGVRRGGGRGRGEIGRGADALVACVDGEGW